MTVHGHDPMSAPPKIIGLGNTYRVSLSLRLNLGAFTSHHIRGGRSDSRRHLLCQPAGDLDEEEEEEKDRQQVAPGAGPGESQHQQYDTMDVTDRRECRTPNKRMVVSVFLFTAPTPQASSLGLEGTRQLAQQPSGCQVKPFSFRLPINLDHGQPAHDRDQDGSKRDHDRKQPQQQQHRKTQLTLVERTIEFNLLTGMPSGAGGLHLGPLDATRPEAPVTGSNAEEDQSVCLDVSEPRMAR